ncbi:MAG: efflux RND transporter permease subunit [Acidobacteriota bacterium]
MSAPFLRNPYLLVLSIFVLSVAGFSALQSLPRLEDPRIVHRFPVVLAPFPGASAERVESLVVEPIENALDEIAEIKRVESTSRRGFGSVSVELLDSIGEEDNDEIFSRVRSKIDEVAGQLPQGALKPILDDQRIPAAYTLIASFVWKRDGDAPISILDRLGEDLADRLRRVPGTELVRTYGGAEEEITVLADAGELELLGLSAADLARRAAATDVKRPAGALRERDSTVLLEVDGSLETIDRVRAVPLIANEDGTVLRIGDVADVRRGVREPATQIGLVDGQRGTLVAARMAPNIRIGDWATGARAALDSMENEIGGDIALEMVFDQSVYTNARLAELTGNLLLGALVVMIVVLLTMGWRLALLVGAALPLTGCAVLFAVLMLGGQLHQMSIFGMIIALGLLIDNAIVVVDEIRKRREEGLGPLEALNATSEHLRKPLFASTLTTALAFAPIVLLPGAAGDFVGYIGVSVILAVSFSYIISLTIIAALAGRAKNFHTGEEQRSWWQHGLPGGAIARRFRSFLRFGLRVPLAAIAVAITAPVVGFILSTQLGNSFFPPTDRNMFDIQVWLPTDASIQRTVDEVSAIESLIRDSAGVTNVHWMVGSAFPPVYYNLIESNDNSPHYARGVIVSEDADATARLVPELQAAIDGAFPEAQVVLRSFGQGPPVEAGVSYRLFGPDPKTLQNLGEEIRLVLQSHPDVLHTQVSMPRGEPKLWLEADEVEVQRAGLTLTDLAAQLDDGLEGAVGGAILEDLEQLPVRVRLDDRRGDVGDLGSLRFASRQGSLPLESVGRLALRPEAGGISRYDGERCNTISGYSRAGSLPIDTSAAVLAQLDESGFELPTGYRLEVGGSAEEDSQAVGDLLAYAPVLFTIMIATIILVFRSVRIAVMLLFVAGLSVGLALLSTWSIGFPVSFNTILGTLGLIGVALNDSIVVLAAIRENPRARACDHEAILDEVMGCTRHVVSTTLTTIGGFLPLLLLIGGQFWPSLAIVLAGGVAGATVLALVFIPATYVLFHQRRHRRAEANQPLTAAEVAA